jgi:predicted nucleic acid-binding protein
MLQFRRNAQRAIAAIVRGERLVLTYRGRPVARLEPVRSARAGIDAALRLLDLMRQTRSLDWEWIGTERFGRAETHFRKHRDQGYTFTDCTGFAVMPELKIDSAVTSDAHFAAAGFRPLLTASKSR